MEGKGYHTMSSGPGSPQVLYHTRRAASTMSGSSYYSQGTRCAGASRAQTLPVPRSHDQDSLISSEANRTRTVIGSVDDPYERFWTASEPSGGQRTQTKTPRGVVTGAGADARQWQSIVEKAIQYEFQNPDLLEEALESPGSGVVVVGKTNRVCAGGNEGLAKIGLVIMKLVLRDQCYLFNIPEGDQEEIIDRIVGWRNLDKLGRKTNIEKMIRPREYIRASKKHNILSLLKDDALRGDPSRTITRGVRAIVGAVYYDGGYQAARRVLSGLGLIIQPYKL